MAGRVRSTVLATLFLGSSAAGVCAVAAAAGGSAAWDTASLSSGARAAIGQAAGVPAPVVTFEGAGQSHPAGATPRLLETALAAVGLRPANPAVIQDAWVSSLAVSRVDPVTLVDLAGAAMAGSEGQDVTEAVGVALAGRSAEDGHLASTVGAALQSIAVQWLPLSGLAAMSPGSGPPTLTAVLDRVRSRTGSWTGSGATVGTGVNSAASRRVAVGLGIGEFWAASLPASASAAMSSVASQTAGYVRREQPVITAGVKARATGRWAEAARLQAVLESRLTKGPATFSQVRDSAAVRSTRRGTETIGVRARSWAGVLAGQRDTGRLSDFATFAVVRRQGESTSLAVTGQISRPSMQAPGDGGPDERAGLESDGISATGGQPEQPSGPTLIVPPRARESPVPEAQVVSIVWPSRPVTLHVPGHGVTLNVPAGARPTVFQTRVSVEPPESLEAPPPGEVLRVVRIEIFDAVGHPVADPSPEKPLDLVIRLDERDRKRLATGTEGPSGHVEGARTLTLNRLDPGAASTTWLAIAVREVGKDAVGAALDHLSLFALVARRPDPGSTGYSGSLAPEGGASHEMPIVLESGRGTDGRRRVPAIIAAAAIAFGGLIAWQVIASLVVARDRDRDRDGGGDRG